MNDDIDSKVLKALIAFDGVLGLVGLLVALAGAIVFFTGIVGLGGVLWTLSGSHYSQEAGAGLSSLTLVISLMKGAILLYTMVQVNKFRDSLRELWQSRDEFFVEKSLQEDRGKWVHAGIRGLIVVFLLLFCTGT